MLRAISAVPSPQISGTRLKPSARKGVRASIRFCTRRMDAADSAWTATFTLSLLDTTTTYRRHRVKKSQVGFTIVEVLVAIIILGVGVSAMAGSAAMVTRMIGEGKQATRMASVASQRMEALRLAAYSTVPRCTAV